MIMPREGLEVIARLQWLADIQTKILVIYSQKDIKIAEGGDMTKIPDRLKKKVPYQAANHTTGYISYEAHLRAYAIYAEIYGRSQTADRLAERGGFGEIELDTFYPEWCNHIIE